MNLTQDKWISIKKKVPNSKTRYAGTHAVTVLGYDEDEYKDSGSCQPYDVTFTFKTQKFMQLAFGDNKSIWIEASITHWMPMPKAPYLL